MPLSMAPCIGSLRSSDCCLLRAAIYIAAHTATALLLIIAIDTVSAWLSNAGDPKLWDLVPVRYLFDTMDLAILIVFIWYGTAEAIRAFRD